MATGMIGSWSPVSTRVRWRMSGSSGSVVNPSAAVCWYRKPMLSGLIRALCSALASASGSVFALPPHRSPQRRRMRFFTGGSGLGGTIVCGSVEVATRISRRHPRGLSSANC
ncbi:MAG TPA: hypothetical protein VK280_09895 [Streptosporangiaceae bacterium]|nr:hypothetical protein [Streptosporangiaceae bacterium]